MKRVSNAALVGAIAAIAINAGANVLYTTPGTHDAAHQYIESFDTLPNTPENSSLQTTKPWADDTASSSTVTGVPGWYLYHPMSQTEGGTNGHQRLRIGTGSATTGTFWSYGASGSTDRALGSVNADTLSTPSDATTPPTTLEEQQMFIGVRITNGNAYTLTSFTVDFRGEQWRKSGNGAETWTFEYSLDPTTTISSPHSNFTAEAAGNFTTPVTTAGAAAVDGNANFVTVGPFTVTGIEWAPGTDLWLRWADTNAPGATSAERADQGMGIDDFHFSALPEPAGLSVLLCGAAGLLKRRAKRI